MQEENQSTYFGFFLNLKVFVIALKLALYSIREKPNCLANG